jgi:hypothetical protein
MTLKFDVSAAMIKDELLADGYIKLDKVVKMGETRKNNYFYSLTGKKFKIIEDVQETVVSNYCWPDGTRKSTGNAFDLSRTKGLFKNSELAAAQNKGKPLNYNTPIQVIAYSRA